MSWNRKRLWLVVKSALAVAIVAAVGWHFWKTLSAPQFSEYTFALRVEYLFPAGLLYLAAHTCWGSFWVRLLRSQGVPVTWYAGLRAYFVSQFGKYVPGKALVILMRVGMLRQVIAISGRDSNAYPGRTDNWLPVAVTATYETLTSMAAGAILAVTLLTYVGVVPPVVSRNISLVFAVAALPVVLALLNKLAARVAARRRGPEAPPLPAPPLLLLAQGLLHGAAGWCLLGFSLGLVVRAVAPESPGPVGETYPGDLAAVALSYVAGFVILVAPGGFGVRELVLEYALAPRFVPALGAPPAHGLAVVIALTLRLTWTAFEVALAFGLYLRKPTRHPLRTPAEREEVHA
jgi:uncharacterized membrane protein YbhN (UPF0104 family)